MELKKTGHNKFAGYDYFELGDFLLPTQTIFRELGLCGVVSFGPDIATLKIVDIETSQEIIFTSPMGSANLKGCHEVQNIGAVETYQRRYLWVAAMEIVEHDALDASTGSEKDKGAATPKAIGKQSAQSKGPEPDAEVLAQMNAARDVAALTKVMNSLSQSDKRLYTGHFNQRMSEFKKAT